MRVRQTRVTRNSTPGISFFGDIAGMPPEQFNARFLALSQWFILLVSNLLFTS